MTRGLYDNTLSGARTIMDQYIIIVDDIHTYYIHGKQDHNYQSPLHNKHMYTNMKYAKP